MNRVCSIFSQILQFFSRREFESAVRKPKAERHARGFTCWGQLVAMLFCKLGRAQSLDALRVSAFDWAQFRRTKEAVKLHLLLDHDGYLPRFAVVTEGRQHEVRVARQLDFAAGTCASPKLW